MNYIILDLEWDTVFYKTEKRFINQIVQIGAVKLDSEFKLKGKLERLVKSSFSKKVSKRFRELTGITTDAMLSGASLADAVEQYNFWAGEDFITLTWSTSDLYAIMDNERMFLPEGKHFKIGKYIDLQSYVQAYLKEKGNELNNQISLAHAAELLGISTEKFDMHTALDDSMITAKILKATYDEQKLSGFIKDTANPEFYKKLTFKNYYLKRLDSSEIKPEHLCFKCEKCRKKAQRTSDWKYKNHWFSAGFRCQNCGAEFMGRVMFKMTYNGLKVAKRILPPKQDRPTEQENANKM